MRLSRGPRHDGHAQIVLDASGNVAIVNARAEVLFGIHPRDTGRPFRDLEVSYRPVELRSVIRSSTTCAPSSSRTSAGTAPAPPSRASSTCRWCRCRSSAARGAPNDTLNTRSLELDHATRLISAVVRSLGDAVAVLDHRLRVMMWSPGAEELRGLRADKANGSLLPALDIGLPVDRLLPDIQRILSGDGQSNGQAAHMTVDAVNRQGRPTRLAVTMSPLHEDDASLHGLIMVMTAR